MNTKTQNTLTVSSGEHAGTIAPQGTPAAPAATAPAAASAPASDPASPALVSGSCDAGVDPDPDTAAQNSQRKAFLFYSNWYTESMLSLTEEEQARFVLVLVRYACDGALPDESIEPVLHTMFGLVRPAIDADLVKYDKITERNRKRAAQRKKIAAQKAATLCVENQRTTPQKPIINNQQSIINNQQSTTEKEKEEALPRFSEVEAYWQERGFKSDSHDFYNHYDAHGWIGRRGERISSWKKAAVMWEDKFRRDVLPVLRREAAAEAKLRRHEQAVCAANVRREVREQREADEELRTQRAVTREQGMYMYRRAQQLAGGDDAHALDLLKRANDDAELYERLCEGYPAA